MWGDAIPSNNWRFATVHGVCPFPWLPGHVCRKKNRNMKTKLLLPYDKFSYSPKKIAGNCTRSRLTWILIVCIMEMHVKYSCLQTLTVGFPLTLTWCATG